MADTKPKTGPTENAQQSKPSATGTSEKANDNKKTDGESTTKKNDNNKINNNKTSTEGGKPRAGSASSQGKNNQQAGEPKMTYKERRKQKDQERYQRKIQNRAENKGSNKQTNPQKQGTPSKNADGKDASTLKVTVDGDGRTVVENKEKTVVETKGKNVIEAPETKQGGEAMTAEEKKLEEHQIFRLAKKSLRFPKAKFYCRLCNYHLDTVEFGFKHVDESRHSKLEKTKKDQEFLRTLPPASDAHHEALTNLLTTVVDKHKLTKQDLDQRAEIVSRVEQVLKKELPKCQVQLYGSSTSGFGFKDSNVNLDIQMPPDVTPAQTLVGADKAMHKHSAGVFTNVVTDFEGKFPCINFTDKKSGLCCQVGTNSACAVDTAKLLREYYNLDARVPVLALALRYWARLCQVDKQADGSMPAYAFVLMVIHFLQQCDPPVLPVIQEKEQLRSTNVKTVGELWLDLLKFYVVEQPVEECVITIRNRKPISRQDMKIPNKRLAVEDPYAVNKKNITKSLTTSVVFQYIMERLREALKYFGLPQYLPGKEPTPSNCYSWFVHTKSPTNSDKSKENTADKVQSQGAKSSEGTNCSSVDTLAKNLSEKLVTNHADSNRTRTESSQDTTDSRTSKAPKSGPASTALVNDKKNERTVESGQKDMSKQDVESKGNEQRFGPAVSDFNFVFEKEQLTGGEDVPLICSGCGAEGHVEKDCQDEVLIDLIPLPQMHPSFMHRIDMLCVNICEEVQTQRWEMDMRDRIIWDLQNHIRRNGYPDTHLQLFGSSMNGFGFHQSDLDICMTLKGASDPKSLNFPEIVEKLAKILKKNRDLYGITPIPTAKVPIVKFIHRPSRLEGDISLYNMLAQVNTRMLHCYSSIDPRVRQLVYTMKIFAKMCDIGDASKGSLSSYAYTLMTLFFLQQRKPPVIPVLQELYTGKEKPVAMMEDWNAWFLEDMRLLPRVWKDHNKNRESVGHLWLGLLRYYTEDFDFKKHVITIRQLKPLTRFEKMWTAPSRGFAIEDPFDLDHNLGGGVSRKMATYMMQVLRRTRERFGLPRRIPAFVDDFDYFFDVDFLSDGKGPPNDRGCRVCGKIGHFLKDCPRRKPKSSESNDRKKEDGKGTSSKQTRDASPKKSVSQENSQKSASQKGAETPKKAAPEKEILKRETPQKTPDSGGPQKQASNTPGSAPTPTKSSQVVNTRPATLTPTSKPLIASTSSSTASAPGQQSVGSKAGDDKRERNESGDGNHPASSGKQRTNSIGDTWEQHKTGKKTSKKKKKKPQDGVDSSQQPQADTPSNQTVQPTSQATVSQGSQQTPQKVSQPSTNQPNTSQPNTNQSPAQSSSQKPHKTVQCAPQVSSTLVNQKMPVPLNQMNQGSRSNFNQTPALNTNTNKNLNQKSQQQGMQPKAPQGISQKAPHGIHIQQRTPHEMQQKTQPGMQQKMQPEMQQKMQPGMQQKMQPGMQQKTQPGMQPGVQQKMQLGMQQKMQPGMQQRMQPGIQQNKPQGLQQNKPQGMQQNILQGMQQKGYQGMQQKIPQAMQQKTPAMQQKEPQGMHQKAPQGMQQQQQQQKGPQGMQQQRQAGPRGMQSNQKPHQNMSSPQKSPYPNNQKFPQQRPDQKTPQQAAQKTPQQILQKPNQKGQQQQQQQQAMPKNQQQKNQQKTSQKNSQKEQPPIPSLAQPPPNQRHVPYSKKRLPKAPNLTQEQQQESQKALIQQMTQGLMQMLQQDKEQRRALQKADLQQQQQQQIPSRGHQVGNLGDKSPRQGAFQQYPVQPPQVQKNVQPNMSPKKIIPAPGPARLQSGLSLSQHADSYTKQHSPTDLGLTSPQYPTHESPQKSPSAIGRSPPKFPGPHSPGSVGVNQPGFQSPGNADELPPPTGIHQPRFSNVPKPEVSPPGGPASNQLKFPGGTQSPVEFNQFHAQTAGRDEPELPIFGSSPSKHPGNIERSPPGFSGGGTHQQTPADQPQHPLHHMMGMSPVRYPMEHLAYSQGNIPGSQVEAKSSRDYHNQSNMMFQQSRNPEEVSPFPMVGNQPVPIGLGGMRRFNSDGTPQGFNPERQAGNQPQSMPTSSPMGMSPAKFPAGGSFDISTWLQFSMSPNSATSQAPLRYPTSNNPQSINMTPFGNLNTSPGTPPFMNYSAPGNPYASNPSQLVGMPPSPPSNQLHQASAVFGANNPSQLGVSPSPPNTQLFQGNLFGAAGVIGSPAGAPYTSSPASMHMLANDSGLGLGYGSSESSLGSQSSIGDRLYREAVTLATTSSTYPPFPQGTASNAAVPTHINVHPKPTVLHGTPTYAPHQLASMYNSEGQPLVHSEVEGQSVIGQSPR